MYMICLFLQHKYSWNFIVWTNDNICMSNFLYKIFMRILQVNIFSWYFTFFSGSFFYGLKDLFTLLHISWQSCPWTLKLMTWQAVELMWICMGGSGAYGHGVARFGFIVFTIKIGFSQKTWCFTLLSPFTLGNCAKNHLLQLVKLFCGHCLAIMNQNYHLRWLRDKWVNVRNLNNKRSWNIWKLILLSKNEASKVYWSCNSASG